MSTETHRVEELGDDLTIEFAETGEGRNVLVLHGSGGPSSVTGFVSSLSGEARVITPTHPGFDGTPLPEWFDHIDDLAIAYLDLLGRLDLREVSLVGFSMGGWIAAEMAVRDTSRLSELILVDAIGIETEGHEIADIFALDPEEVLARNFHDPDAFRIDPATLTETQLGRNAANVHTAALYTRARHMHDAKLPRRLRRVQVPALVLWGESDRSVDVENGRAYARGLPDARFELIAEAGHRPQLEQLEKLLTSVRRFSSSTPSNSAG